MVEAPSREVELHSDRHLCNEAIVPEPPTSLPAVVTKHDNHASCFEVDGPVSPTPVALLSMRLGAYWSCLSKTLYMAERLWGGHLSLGTLAEQVPAVPSPGA